MKSRKIRVLIVDDHDMLREGLTSFLRAFPDLEMVGEASSGSEAIRLCRDLKPEVVLIDLIMPEIDGVSAIQVIHQELPDIHFIALSSFNEDDLIKAALRAGATGYLLKNVSADRLAEAIRASNVGLPILSPEIAQIILQKHDSPVTPNGNRLSHREKEVLNLMITGLSNAEIGSQLNISTFTVKNHVSNILVKMNVSSRTEAVSQALQRDK
ncbi:MAG: DNA-binding response regulator [Anaerolinea sp.]|nr:DNA-binding response regulator [Anaerolinea sp.]